MVRALCCSTFALLATAQVSKDLVPDFWGQREVTSMALDQFPAEFFPVEPQQRQIPLKAGDCVQAVQDIYFFEDDPTDQEFERQTQVPKYSVGKVLSTVLPSDCRGTCPWTVDWSASADGIDAGATFPDQVRRLLWRKFRAQTKNQGQTQCLTVDHPYGKSYKPLVRLAPCDGSDEQVFMTPEPRLREWCSMKTIRFAKDPKKCISAYHKEAIFLVDCDQKDSKQSFSYFNRRFSGMHGRDDMCLGPKVGTKDRLSLMNCFDEAPALEWELIEEPEAVQLQKLPTIN